MIASIHQPSYFPWLGLLHKIKLSDEFILLDITQLSDRGYQHRNIFLNNNSITNLLTIPIEKKNYRLKSINELMISNNFWQKKHENFIYLNYKKHPYFDEIFPIVQKFYTNNYVFLIDALLNSMQLSFDIFGLDTKLRLSSDLELDLSLKKQDMIIHILKTVTATTYLSGSGAKSYQDPAFFSNNNINLSYQEFSHPIYSQINSTEFTPGLSCLDAAFNIGSEGCKKLI